MITILDFEIITKHHRIYQEKMDEIQEVKNNAKNEIMPIQIQMNDIIRRLETEEVKNNIALEVSLNSEFERLTINLKEIEAKYSPIITDMTNIINREIGDSIKELVNEWAIENSIDFIMSKVDVVFNKPEYECTEEILDILKERGLFI